MREQPPDRYRRVGPPRRHAEEPGTKTISLAESDPKGVHFETQEKITTSLAADPWLGVRDRTLAVCTRHRMRMGLHVSPVDTRKLAVIYRQRQRELAALGRLYR